MRKIFKGMSWKTTAAGWAFISGLAGTILADPALAPVIAPYKGYFLLATTVAGYAAHALAKDADVTGGLRKTEE